MPLAGCLPPANTPAQGLAEQLKARASSKQHGALEVLVALGALAAVALPVHQLQVGSLVGAPFGEGDNVVKLSVLDALHLAAADGALQRGAENHNGRQLDSVCVPSSCAAPGMHRHSACLLILRFKHLPSDLLVLRN